MSFKEVEKKVVKILIEKQGLKKSTILVSDFIRQNKSNIDNIDFTLTSKKVNSMLFLDFAHFMLSEYGWHTHFVKCTEKVCSIFVDDYEKPFIINFNKRK